MTSIHIRVCLLALLNAALVAGGSAFQRLNADRGGGAVWSVWLLLAGLCLLPTFFIGNFAFAIGGKLSVFVPVTAVGYVLTLVLAKFVFREDVDLLQGLGCLLVILGVVLIARPK